MTPLQIALKSAALQLPYRIQDAWRNRRATRVRKRMLILRHAGKSPHFYDCVLRWLERELPEVRELFELALLPCPFWGWSRYALCVPWLPDPVEDWSLSAYLRVRRIEAACDQHAIPVVNRVERLASAGKAAGARLMAAAGLRTPQIVPIIQPAALRRIADRAGLPLVIREDRGHGAPSFVVREPSDFRRIPWHQYARPVAARFVDVRDSVDGHYRTYRCFVAGDVAVPRHLIVSKHWDVRNQRVINAATREEEMSYLARPERNTKVFLRARKALGLDVVAFDYSYDKNGQMIVWEANPFPHLDYPRGMDAESLTPYVQRSFAVLVRWYLIRAGLPIPGKLRNTLWRCVPHDAPASPPADAVAA
jgi:hypothetical protein